MGAGRWLAIAFAVLGVTCRAQELAPTADHHQHLLSPQGAALLNNPRTAVDIPAAVTQVLQQHEAAWNEPTRLAAIYSTDAAVMDDDSEEWRRGRDEVARYIGTRFAKPYQITPIAYTGDDRRVRLAALYSRGEGAERRHIGSVMIELVREGDQWRIATEYPIFPGPQRQEPLDAQQLVAMLDAAHIKRAVVLSVGYWFDSPTRPSTRSAEAMQAENTWTAEQAARFPDRLVAFCSLNPVSDAAAETLRRCAADQRFKGLKLHFANSRVDLLNADHVRRIREVFAAANRARLPIVAHVRNGDNYGAREARVVLEQLLPAAPDVTVQIAHLWGGANLAPDALAVYAEAVAARHPATRRLYFDVSDAALVANTPELAQVVADRVREIGLDRILYGSDAAFGSHPDPAGSWAAFRKGIPLSPAEFEKIANNVAPYLR
jgi:predicted TIM-barrel fold metal-dependent hydrolase